MAELRRKIDKYLIEWKNSKDKKPLVIKGARQTGKTTSIEKFGNANYKSFIEINFVSMPEYKTILKDGARNREYVGVVDWLIRAGIVNISYSLDHLEFPLKVNYNPDNYRLYFGDTGLLIGSLDEESQKDLRNNQNFGTYKGAIYENIIGEMLIKAGFDLYFYRDDPNKVEMDFIIRDEQSIIPIEVKAGDNATYSLNRMIDEKQYKNIKYGIKICNKNIGFNGKFYAFPYFMTFFLKRFLNEKSN